MSQLEKKFTTQTPRSAEFNERAKRVMPGGEARSAAFHPPYSVVIDHAEGARLWDLDGNEYLDLNYNYSSLLHGHAFAPVVEAAHAAVSRGSSYAAKTESQVELAELIASRVRSIEQVRYTSSGSEAVQLAIMIARAYNGRSGILVANFSYHGHFLDPFRFRGEDAPSFVGTHYGTFGDAESFERVLAEHGDEIAVVLLEPWLGAGGLVGAPHAFFARVQAAAAAAGALFVLDEAGTFRLSVGGGQQLIDVDPDLTILGKYVGGGFAFGGVGGRTEIMELVNPAGGALHVSGTFSGNPVTMAAGVAAVSHYGDREVEAVGRAMARIDEALARSASSHQLPYSSRRIGSIINIWLTDEPPVVNHVRSDRTLARQFHLACMANGVFATPRTMLNVSTVMTDDDIVEVIQRLDCALADVAGEA